MPALLSIEACIVLCRLTDIEKGPTYNPTIDGAHDPCVWIRDARAGDENYWHSFYADEVVALMRDLAKIDFSDDKRVETIGAVKHKSERHHSVKMTGHTVAIDKIYELEWEISLGNFWEDFPFLEVAGIIERQRIKLGEPQPRIMLPVHPSESWAANKLLEYIEQHLARPGRPPHMFLPTHINRPEGT